MDDRTLSRGDYVVGGGGLVFLVASLLPWFQLGGVTRTGLSFFVTGIVPLLLVAGCITSIVLDERTEVELPEIPAPWRLVQLVGTGLALLLVLVRLSLGSTYPGVNSQGEPLDLPLDTKYGIFLAVLAGMTVLAGVGMKAADDGGLAELKPGPGPDPYPPNPGT